MAYTDMKTLLGDLKSLALTYSNGSKGTTLNYIKTWKKGVIPPRPVYPMVAFVPRHETYGGCRNGGIYRVDRYVDFEVYFLNNTQKDSGKVTQKICTNLLEMFYDTSYPNNFKMLDGAGFNELNDPSGVVSDGTYLYIADEVNDRIVKKLLSNLSYVYEIGSNGAGNNGFNTPYGLTEDGTNLYVSDCLNHRVVKRLLSNLSYVDEVGSSGSGDDNFSFPRGLTNDGTNLYITDGENHRIVKRKCSDLTYVSKIGTTGTGNDNFSYPYDIATDNTYLYIADRGNHRIVKRNCSDLAYVDEIGSSGSGNDNFSYPNGITCDGTNIYIADQLNYRIVKRKCSDLTYVSKIGSEGSGNDNFDNPLAVTNDGTYLYVADRDNSRVVKRLLSDLSYVSETGEEGDGTSDSTVFHFDPGRIEYGNYQVEDQFIQRAVIPMMFSSWEATPSRTIGTTITDTDVRSIGEYIYDVLRADSNLNMVKFFYSHNEPPIRVGESSVVSVLENVDERTRRETGRDNPTGYIDILVWTKLSPHESYLDFNLETVELVKDSLQAIPTLGNRCYMSHFERCDFGVNANLLLYVSRLKFLTYSYNTLPQY